MVQGVTALERRLAKLVPAAIENRVKQAMGEAAEQVADDMRALVPVKSGTLKASIGWTFGDAPKGSISLGSAEARGLKVTIFAGGGAAWYARLVEFGTRKHLIKPKQPGALLNINGHLAPEANHPGATKHPFFYPAYRANKRRIKAKISRAVNKALREQGI